MMGLIAAVFVASLLGSPHCAGMCGGIVALCVGMDESERRRAWATPLAYNLGRLLTYSALGACAGTLGAAADLGGSLLGVQRIAMLIAGTGMIVIGMVTILRLRGHAIGCARQPAWMAAVMQRLFRKAYSRPPMARAMMIGLLTGLLPCGWLYSFVLVAAGAGSALHGAIVMAVFWSGTLPIMVTVGLGLRAAAGPLRRRLPAVTACLLIIVGLLTVAGRLGVSQRALAGLRPPTPGADLASHVTSMPQQEMPCCHDRVDGES